MYKYILFDFDGTLINTNDLIVLALNRTSEKFLGKRLSQDDLNSILGKYLDEQMSCLSGKHCQNMALFYREFYENNEEAMTREFPGMPETLAGLKNLGCSMAIVSAKGREGIERGLSFFGYGNYFDAIISAYDVENNKPHPEPALKAMKALNAQPGETLLVGDSPYDILCGKNAGIKTVLAAWTIFPRQGLLALKPDYIAEKPQDLAVIASKG